ncbi:anti-sigma B factor RsbW [Calidifontibacillus oryziterrae]|uniref:anti-sigma B factor RsbW n=1 Tax=Calidifontibacillus oryziterrae TaxID=1191699 RepID=UPI0002DD6235|nr:anti-sigma B factor RsbW [Calidifontibacillus oryziterrae]
MNEPIDFIEMKIPAKPDYISVIRLTISGIANRMGFSYEDIEDLKVALSEAVTNAVHHAYDDNKGKDVTIGFAIFKDRLEIIVTDHGKGFEGHNNTNSMKTKPFNNLSSVEELREGGVGLFLIEALMDKVSIDNDTGGVVISMIKHLVRDEVGHSDNTFSTSETK